MPRWQIPAVRREAQNTHRQPCHPPCRDPLLTSATLVSDMLEDTFYPASHARSTGWQVDVPPALLPYVAPHSEFRS